MSLDTIENYAIAFQELSKLFGKTYVERRLRRLDGIFGEAEGYWKDNLVRFGGHSVKYLLLAEAPPWREEGEEVSYFYKNFERGVGSLLCWAVWNCFYDEPLDYMNGLQRLATSGFMLIDTLPFAMEYTSRIRRKPSYKDLVGACSAFWKNKICAVKNWNEEVKVALAFKLNGRAVISEIGSVALPTGQEIRVGEQHMAAGKSNFTEAKRLSQIFLGEGVHN